MSENLLYDSLKTIIRKTDWKLLVFLLLLLNVKLIIKLLAIVLIYAVNRNFRFGFRFRSSRLPLFYLIVIAIAIANFFLYRLYEHQNYNIVFIIGCSFWLISILAIHQLKLFTERLNSEVLLNTLIIFFLINAIASLTDLLLIIIETGAINPYQYQGLFQKYFLGTGDYIKGITFDTSTTNAILNAFGSIYFLKNKKPLMVLICMIVLLSTGSNLTNILIILSFIIVFIFQSSREQKSIIAACIFLFVIFMAKVSPQNNQYAGDFFKKLFRGEESKTAIASVPVAQKQTEEDQKQKIVKQKLDSEYSVLQQKGLLKAILAIAPEKKPFIPKPSIHSREYQNKNDTSQSRKELISFAKKHQLDTIALTVKDDWQRRPGKLIALQQTLSFFQQHPKKIITGDGMGCFSSKLAFRATALNISGGFPEKYGYSNDDFANNHLATFLYFFTKQKELHSITNTPDSVYHQLAGEYGLAGIAAFLIFYIGFFIKCSADVKNVLPFLFIMLGAFAFGYCLSNYLSSRFLNCSCLYILKIR